jgi:uncharacterized protein (TIGR00725 family)
VRRRIIGIMGAARAGPESLEAARRLGRLVAERGWVVLTGGRPAGVMEAACEGAKEVPGSITLGILPSAGGEASGAIDLAVFTGMGDARNAINVLTSDVVVACGVEGPGTASEIALALKAGRPVVLLGAPADATAFYRRVARGERLLEADTPEEAVRLVERLLDETGQIERE